VNPRSKSNSLCSIVCVCVCVCVWSMGFVRARKVRLRSQIADLGTHVDGDNPTDAFG
jgi:hypothetical protein